MASPNNGTIAQYINLIYQQAAGTNEHDPVFATAEQTLSGITQAGFIDRVIDFSLEAHAKKRGPL